LVAHPGLIPTALEVFNQNMTAMNQIESKMESTVSVSAKDLLSIGKDGTITEAGLRGNISVGYTYLEAWLRGNGCVPLNNLMEDAATAEIARCQVWQWIKHGAKLTDGRQIVPSLVQSMLDDEDKNIRFSLGNQYSLRKYPLARQLFQKLLLSEELEDFLTLPAYPHICTFVTKSKL